MSVDNSGSAWYRSVTAEQDDLVLSKNAGQNTAYDTTDTMYCKHVARVVNTVLCQFFYVACQDTERYRLKRVFKDSIKILQFYAYLFYIWDLKL